MQDVKCNRANDECRSERKAMRRDGSAIKVKVVDHTVLFRIVISKLSASSGYRAFLLCQRRSAVQNHLVSRDCLPVRTSSDEHRSSAIEMTLPSANQSFIYYGVKNFT